MGYITDFEFYVYDFASEKELPMDKQDEIFKILDEELDISDCGERFFSAKWYSVTEDMIEFSKRYPEYLFEIYGDGEDPDDKWKGYYHNGKHQICIAEIVYTPLDKKLLE